MSEAVSVTWSTQQEVSSFKHVLTRNTQFGFGKDAVWVEEEPGGRMPLVLCPGLCMSTMDAVV